MTFSMDDLQRILDGSSALRGYMDHIGPDEDAFIGNGMYRDCCYARIDHVVMCIDRLHGHDPEVCEGFGDVMAGVGKMRGCSVHGYEHSDPSVVWRFLTGDLPKIEGAAERALYGLSSGGVGMGRSDVGRSDDTSGTLPTHIGRCRTPEVRSELFVDDPYAFK